MKTEHRHDLKTNELGKLAARVKPFIEKRANYIIIGVCVALVVGAGLFFWSRTTSSTALAATSRMFAASSSADFADIADEYPSLPLGIWARLLEAENHLFVGIRLSFTDRSAALSELSEARESFEKVLAGSRVPSDARERALYGLARTLETLSGEDTTAAVEAYERLLEQVDDTVYFKIAQKRIADLKSLKSRQFYAWYQAQNPKPPDLDTPRDGSSPFSFDPLGSSDGFRFGHPSVTESPLPEIPDELKLPEDSRGTGPAPFPDGFKQDDESDTNKPKSGKKDKTTRDDQSPSEKPSEKSSEKPSDLSSEKSSRGNKAPAKPKAGENKTPAPKPDEKKKTGSAGDAPESK